MNRIDEINLIIVKKVMEIVFVITFLFIAFYYLRLNSNFTYANENSMHLTIRNDLDFGSFPMDDEFALNNLESCVLDIVHTSSFLENYQLVLQIDKNSTVDYNFLNIAINNHVYSLSSLIFDIDDYFYYFILDSNQLDNDYKSYQIKLWLDKKTGNEMQGKNLELLFDLWHVN